MTDKCPACGSTTGYEGTMTETHSMYGQWGFQPEAGESGINVRMSLMRCIDCGFAFNLRAADKQKWPRLP